MAEDKKDQVVVDEETCLNCYFSHQHGPKHIPGAQMKCYRFPPVPGAGCPSVAQSFWCGEFKKDK